MTADKKTLEMKLNFTEKENDDMKEHQKLLKKQVVILVHKVFLRVLAPGEEKRIHVVFTSMFFRGAYQVTKT